MDTTSPIFEVQWLYEGPEEATLGPSLAVSSYEDCTWYGVFPAPPVWTHLLTHSR